MIKPSLDLNSYNFNAVFPNSHPIEVEIGCGRAKFAYKRAETSPDINVIALDRVYKFMKRAILRAERGGLKNLEFIKTEAIDYIEGAIPDHAVSAFHVYCPDPWPKKKHHKRRLVTTAFLRLLHRKTVPGGFLYLSTDHDDYAAWMKEVVTKSAAYWKLEKMQLNKRICLPDLKTSYEHKFSEQGQDIRYWKLSAKKLSAGMLLLDCCIRARVKLFKKRADYINHLPTVFRRKP